MARINTYLQMLSIQTAERIDAVSGGETAKAMKLVAMVDRQSDEKLPVFIKCLRDSAHSDVADILEGRSDAVADIHEGSSNPMAGYMTGGTEAVAGCLTNRGV